MPQTLIEKFGKICPAIADALRDSKTHTIYAHTDGSIYREHASGASQRFAETMTQDESMKLVTDIFAEQGVTFNERSPIAEVSIDGLNFHAACAPIVAGVIWSIRRPARLLAAS